MMVDISKIDFKKSVATRHQNYKIRVCGDPFAVYYVINFSRRERKPIELFSSGS